MIFNLAAPTAGKKPPSNPISRENPSDIATIDGDNANEKANSEKEPKLRVEIVKNCSNDAIPSPTKPPTKDRNNDSIKNASRILLRKKPSARKVPISTVRFATAPYMVIIAPIMAPVLKMTVDRKSTRLNSSHSQIS